MTHRRKSNADDSQDTRGTNPTAQPTLSKTQISLMIAVAVALMMLFASGLLVWLWRNSLPIPIAVHWGASGQPDGFASLSGFVWPLVGIMGISIFLMAAFGFAAQPGASAVVRVVIGTIIFLGAMSLLITIFFVGPQRGLESAVDAQMSWWGLAATLGGSALLGTVAGVIGPRTPVPDASEGPGEDALRASLPKDDAFTWVGRTSLRLGTLWGLLGAMLVLFARIGIGSDAWVPFLITVPILPFVALLSVFTVRVGPHGLNAKALLGWPNKKVSALQINEVDTVEVHPFQEFGGWGYRIQIDGTEGIVLRKGPGIRIRYGNTSVLVVTLNSGAEEAAALLNSYADVAQGRDD